MVALVLLLGFGQATEKLPPYVTCCRLLADIEFLLGVDAASRATLEIQADTKSPEYSVTLGQRLKEAQAKATGTSRAVTKLFEAQKTALVTEFSSVELRRDREHFLDKVSNVMLQSEFHFKALKPLYEVLVKKLEAEDMATSK